MDFGSNSCSDPGEDTEDKVFLLSIQEAKEYFPSDETRRCAPTAYAKAQGAWTGSNCTPASGEATCWWWLRSSGSAQIYATYFFGDGSLCGFGDCVDRGDGCVRPAMWIDLGA